jgi:hypothetical protein
LLAQKLYASTEQLFLVQPAPNALNGEVEPQPAPPQPVVPQPVAPQPAPSPNPAATPTPTN